MTGMNEAATREVEPMRRMRNGEEIAAALAALVAADPALVPVAEKAGPLPERAMPEGFAGLCEVIAGQMISKQAAAAIFARLKAACQPLTAESFLTLDPETLAKIGLTRAKQKSLTGLATAVAGGELELSSIGTLESQAAINRLTRFSGVGQWTAEVYLLFSCGHPDIFPAGDLALRAAFAHAFEHAERPEIPALRKNAARWSPHRSAAARLFWAYYAAEMKRDVLPVG